MTQVKNFLTTNEVSEMLGLHRNTLTNKKYSELLKPLKHANGRDNLYEPEVIAAYMKKVKEENPKVVFPADKSTA